MLGQTDSSVTRGVTDALACERPLASAHAPSYSQRQVKKAIRRLPLTLYPPHLRSHLWEQYLLQRGKRRSEEARA